MKYKIRRWVVWQYSFQLFKNSPFRPAFTIMDIPINFEFVLIEFNVFPLFLKCLTVCICIYNATVSFAKISSLIIIMGNQNHIYSLDSFLDIDLLNSLKYSPMSNKSFTVSCWLYAFYHLFFSQPQDCCQCQHSVPHYGYTTYGRKFSSLSMMCTMSFKASLTMLISPTEKSGFPLLSFWMIMVSDVPEDRTTRLRVSSTERMLTRRSPLFVICDDQSILCRWESHKSTYSFIQRAHHQEIAFCWSWMTKPRKTQLLSALYHLHTYILLYPVSLQKNPVSFVHLKIMQKRRSEQIQF